MVADTVWHSFYNLPPLLKDEDGLVLDEDELPPEPELSLDPAGA